MKLSEYEYRSGMGWLDARRGYLTASQIVKLLPEYKRVCAGKVEADKAPAFLALAAEHMQEPTEDMAESRGAAARGHVMEPYAVTDYNLWLAAQEAKGVQTINSLPTSTRFYGLDDLVIIDDLAKLGWSPDGCDIWPQYIDKDKAPGSICQVEHGIEIKSYTLEQATKKLACGWDKVDERWQCACAFAVVPTLKTMSLVFYLPQIKTFRSHVYKCKDLKSEIQDIVGMSHVWRQCQQTVRDIFMDCKKSGRIAQDEKSIQLEYLKSKQENW